MAWQGRRQRRRQREDADKLAADEVNLARAEGKTAAVIARSRQVRTLLTDLQSEAGVHLEQLRALVEAESDYALYTPAQRAQVATTVSLMTTTISLMSTALADEGGVVSDLSGQVVDDARERLQDLTGERTGERTAAETGAGTPAPAETAAETDEAGSVETMSRGHDLGRRLRRGYWSTPRPGGLQPRPRRPCEWRRSLSGSRLATQLPPCLSWLGACSR